MDTAALLREEILEEDQIWVSGGWADPAGLHRIVDRRWDPPVSLGVRLVRVADDSLQHTGHAAYVRGLLKGREAAA